MSIFMRQEFKTYFNFYLVEGARFEGDFMAIFQIVH